MPKSSTQPLCRYCAKPIKKTSLMVLICRERTQYHSDTLFSRYAHTAEPVKSKAECEKLTNQQVLSVSWSRGSTADYDPAPEKDEITSFGEWDGESYDDLFFCSGAHAKDFAYSLARSTTFAMPAYHDAIAKRTKGAA